MAKSFQDLLDQAEKVAKAANLRVAALVILLVVTGLNIEKKFGVDPKAVAEARTSAEASLGDDDAKILAAVRFWRLLLEGETEAPPNRVRLVEERAGCSAPNGRAPSETLDVARCIRLYFRQQAQRVALREQLSSLSGGKDAKELQRLRAEPQSQSQGVRAVQSKRINKLESDFGAQRDALKRSYLEIAQSYGRVKERLSEEIDLEIWKGVPPIRAGLVFAPLLWLSISLAVLLQLRLARRTFWTLVDQAFARRGNENTDPPRLYDMPLWLAPAVEARGTTLLGWDERPGFRSFLMTITILLLAVAILRVAWIGSLVAAFQASSGADPAEKLGAWLALAATPTVAAIAIMTAVRALVPERSNDVSQDRRRFFRVATAAAGALILAQQAGVLAQRYWFPKRPRFRTRRRSALFAKTKLKPGFYRHKRSGAIYLLRADGRLPGANPRIRQGNLTFEGDKPPVRSFGPFLSRSPALTVRPGDIELAAMTLWSSGRGEDAVKMLLDYSRRRRLDGASDRAVQSPVDLAVGLALHDNMTNELEAIVGWADGAGLLTSKRREHWLDDAGKTWRRKRWSPTSPVSWGGQRWTRQVAASNTRM